MPPALVRSAAVLLALVVGGAGTAPSARATPAEPAHSAELDAAIIKAAKRHGVPERLVRRIIMRESKYNAAARNRAYWGLMQISYPTARSMGFKGTPEQLLNPFVNLSYAVPYLANAFVIAGKQDDLAVRLYASGYYATAKARGLLSDLRTANSSPLNGVIDEPTALPTAVAADTSAASGWSLFGSPAPATPAPAAPQQLAYAAEPPAAAAQAQIQTQLQNAPRPSEPALRGTVKTADKNADASVAMVAARDGSMAPPTRWQHDGGTSLVARGEQPAETVAAARREEADDGKRHGRARKIALFAQLEPVPATGQSMSDAPAANAWFGFGAAAPPPADAATAAAPAPETASDAKPARGEHVRGEHGREKSAHRTPAKQAPARQVAKSDPATDKP